MDPLIDTRPPRLLRAGYCLSHLAACGLDTDPQTARMRLGGLDGIWYATTREEMESDWDFFRRGLRRQQAMALPRRRPWRRRLTRLLHRPAVWHVAAVFLRQRHIIDGAQFRTSRALFCHAILHADTRAEAQDVAHDAFDTLEEAQEQAQGGWS